jgi:TPR repeat protein
LVLKLTGRRWLQLQLAPAAIRESGRGVPRDLVEAAKSNRLAAAQGSADRARTARELAEPPQVHLVKVAAAACGGQQLSMTRKLLKC